ncbi:MAG: type II toxin-antitoxin system HicA family toxin [Euryarchaeota archaeon]|nr:type II toxin-antitoxin system HicA family toxin [Euryarchaeota archaeon]
MSKLTPVRRRDLIRRLRKLGFGGPYSDSGHQYMVKEGLSVRIPNPHHGERISVGLLAEILKKAKIDRDEWLSA